MERNDMARLSTLCYLVRDGKYLMLHRVKKKNDINQDKWIGVGGHFEEGESPEECVKREVKEETGYELTGYRFCGIVTFICRLQDGSTVTEYMHLFTSDSFTGVQTECDEGDLEWVKIEEVTTLPLWEGDKIFLKLMETERPFFSLKLVYEGDCLKEAVLDGREIEEYENRKA